MSREEKKNILAYSFSGLLVLSLIAFASIKNGHRLIEQVKVDIQDQGGAFFTDQFEVIDLITDKSADYVIGVEVNEINPKILEERVESNPFVKDAQVFRDLKGNLEIDVVQSKPIARIFVDGKQDKYIDADGRILPINARHTARVLLLETQLAFIGEGNLQETTYGHQVFELLNFIEKHPFWKAQIAHVILEKNGEVKLYPQVTRQVIEMGMPEDLEKKFDKLMIFYKKILPEKGWNSYSRVNLKFENQIICE